MAEPGQLPGGCALTKGLRARARRRPGGEGAGALLRALEGGGCASHSEEPAPTAVEHTQLCPGLRPAAFEQTRQPPGSHTCRAATGGCRPAPPPGRSPPSAAGPAPCSEAKPRPLSAAECGERRVRKHCACAPVLPSCRVGSSRWKLFHSGTCQAVASGLWRGQKVILQAPRSPLDDF